MLWLCNSTEYHFYSTAVDTKCSKQPTTFYLVMNIKISFAIVFALNVA